MGKEDLCRYKSMHPTPTRSRHVFLAHILILLLAWAVSEGEAFVPRQHCMARHIWSRSSTKEEESSREDSLVSTPSSIPSSSSNNKQKNEKRKTEVKTRRKMELMWCSNDYCKESIRERVVDEHVILNGPATGQVAYYWQPTGEVADDQTVIRYVLLFVRPGDDNLLKIASEAIKEWTAKENNEGADDQIRIMLDPTTAARLEHNYGVRSDCIHLFEAEPTPGFGSHLASDHRRKDGVDPWDIDNQISTHTVPGKIVPDLIVTLGGDGQLMHAGMLFQGPIPPILSVAGGSLGFLTPFKCGEMGDAVRISLGMLNENKDHSLNGSERSDNSDLDHVFPPNMASYPYDPLPKDSVKFGSGARICLSIRMRLCCQVINREGVMRARINVLNEVVIDRGSSPYLAALECFCDDVHLTTVQADGIIFATPTGSTAYSMAAGGSVVHPAVPCILVTPICPHVLSFRSMVFPDHVVLRCYVPDDARASASVAFDGKHRQELRRGESVQIQLSAYPVPTLNRYDHSSDWLGSLKQNFNFNTRPRQRPL